MKRQSIFNNDMIQCISLVLSDGSPCNHVLFIAPLFCHVLRQDMQFYKCLDISEADMCRQLSVCHSCCSCSLLPLCPSRPFMMASLTPLEGTAAPHLSSIQDSCPHVGFPGPCHVHVPGNSFQMVRPDPIKGTKGLVRACALSTPRCLIL